jgi:hypothetical protein
MRTKRGMVGLVVIAATVGALAAGATATIAGGSVAKSGHAVYASVPTGSATTLNLPSEIYYD